MVGIRKIAAILVSDVVGYSRLTGADEDRTEITTVSRLDGWPTAAGEVPLPTPKHAFIVAQADRRDGRMRRSTTAQIVVEGCALAVLVPENG